MTATYCITMLIMKDKRQRTVVCESKKWLKNKYDLNYSMTEPKYHTDKQKEYK